MRCTFTTNMHRTIESLSIITNTPAPLAVNYRPFCLRITERSTCPSEPRISPSPRTSRSEYHHHQPASHPTVPRSWTPPSGQVPAARLRRRSSNPLWGLAAPWRHLWPGSWRHVPDCRHSPCRARGACPPDDRSQVLGTRSWRDVTYFCRAPAVL